MILRKSTVKSGVFQYNVTPNTLLYLPVDDSDSSSTVYDHSLNNNNNSWYGTANYETLATWKRVLKFTWSNWIYIDSPIITSQPVTISLRLYRDWNQGWDYSIFINQSDWSWKLWWVIFAFRNTTNASAFYGSWNAWNWMNNTYSIDNQTWKYITITLNNNKITTYINSVEITNASWNTPLFSYVTATSIWFTRTNNVSSNYRFMRWKVWEIIVENKIWTNEERNAYFNKTKSKYWY